jgi:hypothetical protein
MQASSSPPYTHHSSSSPGPTPPQPPPQPLPTEAEAHQSDNKVWCARDDMSPSEEEELLRLAYEAYEAMHTPSAGSIRGSAPASNMCGDKDEGRQAAAVVEPVPFPDLGGTPASSGDGNNTH